MNVMMLRGLYPRDRKNPNEIFYDSIEQETDMWTELLYGALRSDERGSVYYLYGPDVRREYREGFTVLSMDGKALAPPFASDVIFARGGFPHYSVVLDQNREAKTIYYGAGKRYMPDRQYDMALVDCEWQRKKVKAKYPDTKVRFMVKPASHIFRPIDVEKKYDVCFVAIHPGNPRKRVEWVYDTVPKGVSVLQLGNAPRSKVPENVTVKHVLREKMPKAMSKCHVGIAPYTKDDSGPRVVPEFMACGLPVVIRDDLSINTSMYPVISADSRHFWGAVKGSINTDPRPYLNHYQAFLSIPAAAEVLRGYFEEALDG